MAGSQRSMAVRCLLMGTAALLLITGLVAGPTFLHGQAAPVPFGNTAFAAQWNSIEPKVPNFWGPAYQNIFPEQYQEATPSGQRFVQYFDKARMEQTTAGGPVTNGLLTVELISGQRQFGDNLFTTYPPASIPVVGDPTNTFPTYAALGASVFPNKVAQSAQPIGTVYNADGTLTINSQQAAVPGAAFGSFQGDPGGKYAHNVPLAFWSYLTALPVPWQTTMGYPLTEAFWVQVTVNNTPMTWVLVQPFERRVLSYTPSNPSGFQVEMGNIGQHYFQWRYTTNPGGVASPATATPIATVATSTPDPCATATPLPTATGTPSTATATPTATPFACTTATATDSRTGVEIVNVHLTAPTTDTTFSLGFQTNLPATSYIRWGTTSGSYPFATDISTSQVTSHSITLTGLTPNTVYYYTIRVTSSVDAINRPEDYFITSLPATAPDTPTPIGGAPVPPRGGPPPVSGGGPIVVPPPKSPPLVQPLTCSGFTNQAAAQANLRLYPSDPNMLDPGKTGIACPNLPAPYDMVKVPRT
ncbi:MAG: fibronectin type III domain-containing protein [Thermomicrobiales bacterium]